MTSRDFAFWLQGLFEVGAVKTLNAKQVELIKRHLNLVFIHEIDPSMGDAKEQEVLNKIHEPDYLDKLKESPYTPPPFNPNSTLIRC